MFGFDPIRETKSVVIGHIIYLCLDLMIRSICVIGINLLSCLYK
jgi:hypothetical protein